MSFRKHLDEIGELWAQKARKEIFVALIVFGLLLLAFLVFITFCIKSVL